MDDYHQHADNINDMKYFGKNLAKKRRVLMKKKEQNN